LGRAVAQGWTLGNSSHREDGQRHGGLQDVERGPEKYEKFLKELAGQTIFYENKQHYIAEHNAKFTGLYMGFSGGKEPACSAGDIMRSRFDTGIRKIPWKGAWQSTPVFLPGESQGQRSPVGYSP